MNVPLPVWAGFLTLIAGLLALDLGVFHRRDEVVSARSSLRWVGVWFGVAMLFNVAIYGLYERHLFGLGLASGVGGKEAAASFLTGYLVEQSLSLDNIFVMALVFRFFQVPAQFQHRVLFWGILGAIVLRISMILAGAALISRFHQSTYVFGGLLLVTAIKMGLAKSDESFDPGQSRVVKLIRRLVPISEGFDGHRFFTRVNGALMATPLLLALIVVEFTDAIFAVDSIPAIFGITTDPFLVFTSNIFALLGLRSLYFALASLLDRFVYLKHSLVLVLGFVGLKMLVSGYVHIAAWVSLLVIVTVLGAGILASFLRAPARAEETP
ncbi:MAG: TerC family protein [Myxococcales bacterium]|nr:MAG: TerC family protein [Myxococcales bacterium]